MKSRPKIIIRRAGRITFKYVVQDFYGETLAQGSAITKRKAVAMANEKRAQLPDSMQHG